MTAGAQTQSAAAPEFSLGLAGSVILSRYRVNAVSSVNRDVVLYSAEHMGHGRSIALKVLRDEFARDAQFVAAVRDQAGALAVAAHVLRGVQRVYEFGVTDAGQCFVALEWVEGASLREVLDAGGALDVATALRVAIRVGEALEALHHTRLVHGELGPDSVIMVNDGERIRLVGTELTAAYRTPTGLRLRDGFSLAYRAPEQLNGGETTAASDVYALGMLLRQLLSAGKAGQPGSAFAATPPLSSTIQRIISTALEARPERRYADISVMVNDIWGATAVLPELESRPRSAKARGNPRRRVRRRRRPFTARITAAVVTACVVASVVWVAGFDRIVSRFYREVTPPPVTAVPVHREVVPPSELPSSASTSRDEWSAPASLLTVPETSRVESPAPAVAAPALAPPSVRESSVERSASPVRAGQTSIEPSSPPVTVGQPSVESSAPPFTARQPSVEPSTPAAPARQPSVEPTTAATVRQPSVEASVPPATMRQPSVMPSAPAIGVRQPSVEPSVPPAGVRQPSMVPSAPPISVRQPSVESSVPPAGVRQPSVEASVPPASVRQPSLVPSAVDARPSPVVGPRPPAESDVASERRRAPERPARVEGVDREAGDGSAVIDWLLKGRR